MAEYVVDASAVIPYFLTETYTPQSQVLLSRLNEGDELYLPEFCLIECANVLRTNVRFNGLPQIDAEQMILELMAMSFQIAPVKDLLTPALKIGLTYQLAIYDSLYIAMAIVLDCPLITVDNRQAVAARNIGVILKPITDFVAID